MKKILAILLLALLIGCVSEPEKTNETTVVEDTELLAPSLTPSGYIKNTEVTVEAEFSEPVLLTGFKIDDTTQNITKVSSQKYKVIGSFDEGNHSISVSAEDAAYNSVNTTSWFFIDSVVPNVTVDPEDNEQVSISDVDFILTFTEEVTLTESKLDSTKLKFSTTNNKRFTLTKTLTEGTYDLKIKAEDNAGNKIESETDFTVSFAEPDSIAPPEITGVNATDSGNTGEIKLTWDKTTVDDFKEYHIYQSSSDINTVSGRTANYKISGKSTNKWTITGLTDGERYCFAVTAVDNSDNELHSVVDSCDKPTESDKTPPRVKDESPTDLVTNTNKPEIYVETDESATCKYGLSNESDLNWKYSNLTYTLSGSKDDTEHTKTHPKNLDNDTYYVYVLCKDEETNVMEDVHDWEFEIEYAAPPDTTAPSLTIDEPSNTTYLVDDVWFNVSTNENADWCKYSVNGASNTSLTGSNKDWYKNLSPGDGSYHVEFFCSDDSNVGTDEEWFTIDTTPPSKVTSISKDNQTNVTMNITWTYSEPSDFDEYWLYIETSSTSGNATSLTKETSTSNKFYEFTGLTNDTDYYFLVVAVDDAGNKFLDGLTEKMWTTDA